MREVFSLTELRDMRSMICAVLEEKFGTDKTKWDVSWLDTDEGRNHRHILGIWDSPEYEQDPEHWSDLFDYVIDKLEEDQAWEELV